MRKKTLLLLAAILAISFSGCRNCDCEKESLSPTDSTTVIAVETQPVLDGEELVILYTNDLHGGYLRDDRQGALGFPALAAYKKGLEQDGFYCILLDGGDAFIGSDPAFKATGIVNIMDHMNYSFAVPGEQEFALGNKGFLHMAENLDTMQYLCCNFPDAEAVNNPIKPYEIIDYNGINIAFLGITSPDHVAKLQDDFKRDGEQVFYDMIQNVIDEVKAQGADYVIALAHLGTNPADTPFTSVDVIKRTTGLNILLDGHSHSVIENKRILDMDDRAVLLCSGGSDFAGFMDVRLNLETGELTVDRITEVPEEDTEIQGYVETLKNQEFVYSNQVIGSSEVELNSIESDGVFRSRLMETPMGNFCADAYRMVLDADIAIVNAGNIHGKIPKGDITIQNVCSVVPADMEICIVQTTGQKILDALEVAYRYADKEENPDFLQISGITCRIDSNIPSGVILDDNGNFCGVSGERRVCDVMVNGTPIQPDHLYTVASNTYLLQTGGNGFSMFLGDEIIQKSHMTESQILLCYIQQDLNGVISAEQYGAVGQDKRIDIIK